MSAVPVTCRRFVELVTEYLEDGLDEETARQVEAHLDLCDPCLAYVDQVRSSVDALRRLQLAATSPGREALLEAFRSRDEGP